MDHEFDTAIADLGVPLLFNDEHFATFALKRDDNSEIPITFFKDFSQGVLRMTAHTSHPIPSHITPEFFAQFAEAALEPLRGGIGVGVPRDSQTICVHYTLRLDDYERGQSLVALESLVEQVEVWEARLLAEK